MAGLGLDALTLSGHKFAAPKGVGALVLADGVTLETAFMRGGGQERRQRCGTECLPAIVGMGEAARIARESLDRESARLGALRDRIEAGIRALAPDAVVFAAGAQRLPNTLSFSVPGLDAPSALIALDLAGVAVSSGSACSSGKVARSATLAAMGVGPDLAGGRCASASAGTRWTRRWHASSTPSNGPCSPYIDGEDRRPEGRAPAIRQTLPGP